MPRPELVLRKTRPNCQLSIILLDWGVRESFHALQYLNQQAWPRNQYELIWLEFYQRKPLKLQEMVFGNGKRPPYLDQWIIAGYPGDTIFNKHRLYNLGLLLAQGKYCVICDSDAIFTPRFVERVLDGFENNPHSVLHLDEIRNNNKRFYPFGYPSIEEILDDDRCINWEGNVSKGLNNSPDMIHDANYGACMAASLNDLIAIGGADEHPDYLGYICGPYDMTFRLVNRGLTEHWLRDEYLYHVWHPNESGINTDYQGPHDGAGMSLRSLQARACGRVEPYLENPWIADARRGNSFESNQLLQMLAAKDEPTWTTKCAPSPEDCPYLVAGNYQGFNVFNYREQWYGLKVEDGFFDPARAHRYRVLLQSRVEAEVRHLISYYNELPTRWWKRLGNQPLHRLPGRLARRIGKELARIF